MINFLNALTNSKDTSYHDERRTKLTKSLQMPEAVHLPLGNVSPSPTANNMKAFKP